LRLQKETVEYIERNEAVLVRKRGFNFVPWGKWIEGSFVKVDW
jgi:hypothetical protein